MPAIQTLASLALTRVKHLGPLHYFTAGGFSTYAVLRTIRYFAERSKTVDQALHKGFEVVEDKIEDIKEQVLPEQNPEP